MTRHWSTHQFTEFFSAVGGPDDEAGAIRVAVERAAESLDAEIGAVLLGGRFRGLVGLPPDEQLAAALRIPPGTAAVTLPRLGPGFAAAGRLRSPGDCGPPVDGCLVVARLSDPFGPEEEQVLQGMALVLGLVLRSLRTLTAERHRQQLLESLLAIQRAISARRPLQEVLDAITAGASQLLNGAVMSLVLPDPLAAGQLIVASGATPADPPRPVAMAAAASAMRTDRLVVHGPEPAAGERAIAAPVHVNGRVAGALVAHVHEVPGQGQPAAEPRAQEPEDLEPLGAFAQQVSLALTDARTVEAIREAYHDPLTGLPTRALFLNRLNQARALAHERGEPLAVLFIDLDRFKAVNDSLGHHAGDELLGAVADRVRRSIRSCDLAARLGGDEFAVLLEAADPEQAVRVAGTIVAALSAPFRVAARDVFIGASIGIAPDRSPGIESGELLSNADVAMYRAKRSGTERVAVFEPHMHDEAVDRLTLASQLHQALSRGEFRLQYQPLVALDTGLPTGLEALARWDHPQRGSVPPSVFIPMAEETEAIVEIGRWVLWTAARQVQHWRAELPRLGLARLGLNVNVSPRQVIDPHFVADVAEVLAATRMPPGTLTLELTESLLISDPDAARHRLQEVRDLGVRLSLDDFGTGFSALSYLRRFPVDQVKIDRSFIIGVDGASGEDRAVVRTIVDLGRALRLNTVAEGIETAEQLHALRDLGCDLGQGYHLSRPLEADAVAGYLTTATAASPRPSRTGCQAGWPPAPGAVPEQRAGSDRARPGAQATGTGRAAR